MEEKIYAMSQDPIYIGTGGYCIGRVDNTIVKDPITKIPKIPGTSLGGTWRYYMALEIHSYFEDDFKTDRKSREGKKLDGEIFKVCSPEWVKDFDGNRYAAIKCAGQDDMPNDTWKSMETAAVDKKSGHCGHCIVCETFGFSKQDKSQRGMAYFSDLNILLFPVYTRFGTRWITSKSILTSVGIYIDDDLNLNDDEVFESKKGTKEGTINLGWLNFKSKAMSEGTKCKLKELVNKNLSGSTILEENIIIASDDIISQIINSNLETRTSVSIDPLTGAAKERALFTSEAIPRGTVFYGDMRVEEHPLANGPAKEKVLGALKDSKKYFETLGIGGMTTRGFGRLKIFDWGDKDGSK